MRAEAVWWRCHRMQLAVALAVRGIEMLHVVSADVIKPHHLNEFAKVSGSKLSYPDFLGPAQAKIR